MAYPPYVYQRAADFAGSAHPAAFLSPRMAPFSLPLAPPYGLTSPAAGPHPGLAAAYGSVTGGLGVGSLPNFLLAEYLSHPDYYRSLR